MTSENEGRIQAFRQEAETARRTAAELQRAINQARIHARDPTVLEYPLPEIIWALQHGHADIAIHLITSVQAWQEACASEEMLRQRILHEKVVSAVDTPHYLEDTGEVEAPRAAGCYHSGHPGADRR